jgi:hypothetical protein
MTIRATQNRKLIRPILAPCPHGSQMLVPKAEATSMIRMTIAWAVPLLWPHPMVTPKATLVAKKMVAKSWDPCL